MTQKETWLEAARSIGARLCRDALWSGGRCSWMGCSMELVGTSWIPVQKALAGDLYAGTGGISLFLAELFAETGEPLFRETGAGALALTLSRLDEFPTETSLGFYSGLTGIGYVFLRAGERLGDDEFVRRGLQIFRQAAGADLARQGLDVVAGVAGAIPAFLLIHKKYGDPALLDAAIRAGEHLLAGARPAEAGWSWDTMGGAAPAGQKDLTGFSHGTAGIGWALLELHHATGEQRFRDAAAQAFAYERHWFNPEQENWPDFRSFGAPPGAALTPSYNVAWCHGAPGVGLSRLRAFALTGEAAFRDEAEAAIRTTRRALEYAPAAAQANYCLCHGSAGNAELLLEASRILGDDQHRNLAEQVAQAGIDRFHATRTPWPGGVPGGWETPNLMLGSAGTGHFLLRLYNPQAVAPIVIVGPE